MSCLKPPAGRSRFSPGTRQRSKTTSPSGMPRMPIARSRRVTARPGVPASTIRAPIPADPGMSSKRQSTTYVCDTPAPVIHRLAPVSTPRVAVPLGPRLELRRRRAGAGLGDGDRRLVALEHPRQVLPLLRLGAEVDQRPDRAEVRVDQDPSGHAADARDLLDRQDHVEERPGRSAVGRGHGHAQEPRLDEAFHVVPGILLALVPARRALAELVVGERAGAGSDRLLLGGQRKPHPGLLRALLRPATGGL